MKNPFDEKTWKWIKTTLIAVIGGGVAAAFTAAMDPSKYHFPHDFGSGKLWEYFFEGAGAMFVGLLIKSPMGQQTLSAFKSTQTQLQQSREMVQDTKAELKASVAPPPAPPPVAPPEPPPSGPAKKG